MIFDFDGTLAQLAIDFEQMRRRIAEVVASSHPSMALPEDRPILEGLAWVAAGLEAEGIDPSPCLVMANEAMREIELEAASRAILLPRAVPTLRRLREMGLRVGIITRNCEGAVRRVFPEISEHCDCFLPRDRVPATKPSPIHLTTCLRALELEPAEALVVGDHPMDIEAGRAMGMATVGVLTGHSTRQQLEEAGADWVVASVIDVLGLVTDGLPTFQG